MRVVSKSNNKLFVEKVSKSIKKESNEGRERVRRGCGTCDEYKGRIRERKPKGDDSFDVKFDPDLLFNGAFVLCKSSVLSKLVEGSFRNIHFQEGVKKRKEKVFSNKSDPSRK